MLKKLLFKKYYMALAFSLVILAGAQAVPVQAAGGGLNCQQVSPIAVTLSPSDPTVYHVAGWLCAKGSLNGKTMQLLVHGLTYDHQYWDWPQSPQVYSYVRSATDAGYATFAIDRLGDGSSDHPVDGTSVTVQSGAYVLHQIVQDLRAGSIGGTAFAKIIAVGHSFGSATAGYEAATYHDVDAAILSGMMHDATPGAYASLSSYYPAFLDPKFASSGLNATYFTTMPGTRAQLFFNTATADPSVIAMDEILKQTVTSGEFATLQDVSAVTPQINVPVMLAMGETDFLFCDPTVGLSCANSSAVLARENQHYNSQTCLEAMVQPTAGHDINLHPNAHLWFESASAWANRRIGPDGNHPATQPCQ
jgi:pimeloyl-ACP methyl ester carboxylesterase